MPAIPSFPIKNDSFVQNSSNTSFPPEYPPEFTYKSSKIWSVARNNSIETVRQSEEESKQLAGDALAFIDSDLPIKRKRANNDSNSHQSSSIVSQITNMPLTSQPEHQRPNHMLSDNPPAVATSIVPPAISNKVAIDRVKKAMIYGANGAFPVAMDKESGEKGSSGLTLSLSKSSKKTGLLKRSAK